MSKQAIFTKAADFVHKGFVLGLASVFCFQVYQITRNSVAGKVDSPYMHSDYFEKVEKKVKEEYRKDNVVDSRDWYQAEDDSYLKDQVRPNITQPEFKKQFEQRK